MFITEDDMNRRLMSAKNLINSLGVVQLHNQTKRPLPSELKVVAGIAAHFDSAVNVGDALGLSSKVVGDIKRDPEIKSLVDQKVLNVEELALQRTIEALGLLEPHILMNEKPRDIASIAMNMSRIVANVRKDNRSINNNTQFIVYAPSIKNESEYTVIESNVA